jgi:outer membrane protein OmpA-like peptidoglycan-associated protein
VEPPVDISLADLEAPLIADTPEIHVDETIWVEGEMAKLQSDIEGGRYPPIAFEPGGAILLTSSFEALDTVGAVLRSHPDVRVRIYGFVEESYKGDAREAIALARAEVVRNYLIQNFRLNEFRLSSGGLRTLPDPVPGQPAPRPAKRIEFEISSLK